MNKQNEQKKNEQAAPANDNVAIDECELSPSEKQKEVISARLRAGFDYAGCSEIGGNLIQLRFIKRPIAPGVINPR